MKTSSVSGAYEVVFLCLLLIVLIAFVVNIVVVIRCLFEFDLMALG